MTESGSTQEAQRLLDELVNEGQRALVIIIQTDQRRSSEIEKDFKDRGYGILTPQTTKEAITIYEAFKKADGGNHPVIFVLGGSHSTFERPSPVTTSVQFAKEVKSIAQTNGWNLPFFIDSSTIGGPNLDLQRETGEQYLASYMQDGFFNIVAGKINPQPQS